MRDVVSTIYFAKGEIAMAFLIHEKTVWTNTVTWVQRKEAFVPILFAKLINIRYWARCTFLQASLSQKGRCQIFKYFFCKYFL